MKKGIRNILIGTGITAVAATAAATVSRIITKTLVNAALDREEPDIIQKNRHRVTGSFKDTEEFQDAKKYTQILLSRDTQRVEIESHDGIKLIGHWYECENPRRIIVAMHGWRSSWAGDFGAIADFWHNNGCSVIFAEQRGQGESGGDTIGFGLTERHDCKAWADWAYEKSEGKLPIYLAGLSMGATTVLMASTLNLPQNVRGIMADCGFTSPKAIWKHVTEKNLHLSYGIRERQINNIVKQKLNCGEEDFSTLDAMRENKIPVLFIHGTDDTFVPISMTYENYKACKAPKRLFVVPGAEHGMSYLLNREGYESNVKDFWKQFD